MKQDLNQLFTETITKSTESIIYAFAEINKILMKFKGTSTNLNTEIVHNISISNIKSDENCNKDSDQRQIDKVLKINISRKTKAQEKEFNQLKERVHLLKKKKEEEKAAQALKPQDKQPKKQTKQQNAEKQKENIQAKDVAPTSKPKLPISAYLRFTKSQTESVKKDHPQASQTEITTIISTLWINLASQAKKKYEDEYAIDMQKYQKALMEYYQKRPQQKKQTKSRQKKKKAANHEFL